MIDIVTLVSEQGLDASTTADVGTYVGNISITPTSSGDPTLTGSNGFDQENYIFSYDTGDLTINRRAITVTADAGQGKVYGSADPTLTYMISGFVNGDTEADLDTSVMISRAAGEDVGDYAITVSGATDANYTISFVGSTFTITAAVLTVTADAGQGKVYGTTDPTLTYMISGFQGSDTEADLDTSVMISRAAGEDVGNYLITPSGASDSNYSIVFVTNTFEITQAGLTVTANSGFSKVYGTADPIFTYMITGFIGSDTEASLDTPVSISRAAGEDVGQYVITPSGATDINYSISFVTSTFEITQAALLVTADSGLSKIYGNNDPMLTYMVTGFVNGDTEANLDTPVTNTRAVGEDVGTYSITPSGAADINYTISFVTSTFEITPATLIITGLVGNNKVYDATTVATTTGSAILSGVVSNDDVTLGGSPVFTFESPNPGIMIMISATGYTISGSDSGNYILIQPTLYADITNPDEDCDGDGIIDSEDADFSSCASAIRNTTRYGFSPNGDGINDVWTIEKILSYPNNHVKVFNRSGKLVFDQRGYQNDWNGESNQLSSGRSGYKLPVGPYIFMLELGDGNAFVRGWLYINY
jgi:gliding motility-associated-like protein